MRLIFLSTFFLLIYTNCVAQKNDKESAIVCIQPHALFPVGELKGKYDAGFGGHITVETPFADKLRWSIGLGGTLLSGKTYTSAFDYPTEYPTIITSQLRGGIKFFPAGNGLFINGVAGPVLGIIQNEAKLGYSFRTMLGCEFGNIIYYDISVGYDYSKFKNVRVGCFVISIGYQL
jgi:hypothetical protein